MKMSQNHYEVNSNNLSTPTTSFVSNNQNNTNKSTVNNQVESKFKKGHYRTRSVDLRLTSSSTSSVTSTSKSLSESFLAKIEEKVSLLYYRHGLFCSRHSILVIILALAVVTICSYQIFTYRGIFGSSSEIYLSPDSTPQHIVDTYQFDSQETEATALNESHSDSLYKYLNFVKNSYQGNTFDYDSQHSIPRWFLPNLSYAYVQQIFVRSAVLPWSSDCQLVDALRGPIQLIFELVESISNYQFRNNVTDDINLSDICFQVYEPILSKRYSHLDPHLPSYSCLVLSPSNIWRGDYIQFLQDPNFLDTLLKFHQTRKSPLPSGAMHDIFFGVNFDETGIRHTYGRNRVRTITYSITIVLKRNIPSFIDGLRSFLIKRFPLSATSYPNYFSNNDPGSANSEKPETLHIFFHNTFTLNYLVPLGLFYMLVCLYMYFSVRKTELVRSKFLYALGALITVLLSLFLSFGICFRLGFNSVLMINRLLPYFVAGISFESMLVLTKSVLANPHLDSKVRVAHGLSKEGLSVTKNLIAELTLLTIGSLTFVPFFKECCILAAICLISDFLMQITFFTAFFSTNIQRINDRSINKRYSNNSKPYSSFPKNIYALPGRPIKQKTPKRLRFIYFLARIRLVQRGFMLLLCACIGVAIYNAYLVLDEQLPNSNENFSSRHNINNTKFRHNTTVTIQLSADGYNSVPKSSENNGTHHEGEESFSDSLDVSSNKLSLIELLKSTSETDSSNEHSDSIYTLTSSSHIPFERILYTKNNPPPTRLPNYYWAHLFSLYNISLVGRFISLLPPIYLSAPVSPENAISVRNLADSDNEMLRKFVPMKFSNGEYIISDEDDFDKFEDLKRSRSDIYITIGLSIPSLIFFVYLFILLYRCVCTRNYAEWRTQMTLNYNPFQLFQLNLLKKLSNTSVGDAVKLFRFDITLLNIDRESEIYQNENQFLLNNQDIDLISTNTQTTLVATCSMSSDIRVYDALTCETLSFVKRSKSNSDNALYKPSLIDDPLNISPIKSSNLCIAKTTGNLLKTICDGISVEKDFDDEDDDNESNATKKIHADYPLGDLHFRPIWCIDIFDRYILAGCDDGRLEVWDAHSGQLSSVHYPENLITDFSDSDNCSYQRNAITTLKVTYWGVVLARFNGAIDLLQVELNNDTKYTGLISSQPNKSNSAVKNVPPIEYKLKQSIQAHKQPIVRLEIIDSLEDEEFLEVFGSRGCMITGSLDTTLKVFSLDNGKSIYTLNGHCGAIMTTSIDPFSTATALSGCQLGQLCVWDLNTGTCIFSMQAHSQGEVLAITASPLYYVSSGTDNRICVWDRFSGNLVHSINHQHSTCRNIVFIENHILISTRDGELVVWDVNDAQQLCIFPLSNTRDNKEEKTLSWVKSFQSASIKNLLFAYQRKALICDYGNSLCVINNPFATMKLD